MEKTVVVVTVQVGGKIYSKQWAVRNEEGLATKNVQDEVLYVLQKRTKEIVMDMLHDWGRAPAGI